MMVEGKEISGVVQDAKVIGKVVFGGAALIVAWLLYMVLLFVVFAAAIGFICWGGFAWA